MNLKPTGYYVLIEMEEVSQKVTEGALKGFVMSSNTEHEREQGGHDVGIVRALGPNAFAGYNGCDGETSSERAEQWGCKIGDKVEFNRYDGKVPRYPDYQNHRIIQDHHIIGVIEE
jgi:co-chaperonin GroES (HSP10)